METHFQLTQAATTPSGSHLTSLCLYHIKKFEGLLSAVKAFSPCFIVQFNFSIVTKISPRKASILVFPESRHAIVAIDSWLSRTYLKNIDSLSVTFLMLVQVSHILGRHTLQHRFQDSSSLRKGRLCPFPLRLFCLHDCSVYSTLSDRVYTPKQHSIGRAIALDQTRAYHL